MGYKLWMAKFHYKQMMKYQKYKLYTMKQEKESKKLLQEYLNELDTVDFFRFGFDTGYIPKLKKYEKKM